MPIIVVTRLRLKDPALLDEFFTDAVAAIEQAMKAEGNLGADALADANDVWWSVSAWQERGLMRPTWTASRTWASVRAWMISATRPRSSTGSRPARSCRTGRPAGATSPPTARPQNSRTLQPPTRPGISPRRSSHLSVSPEAPSANSQNARHLTEGAGALVTA